MSDIFGRPVINSFTGDYAFLSNFYRHPVQWRGVVWATSEHAYQAMKCVHDEDYLLFLDPKLTAGQAKRLGRRVSTYSTWNDCRVSVMEDVVEAKFSDPVMASLLLATGDAILIEGNTWGDTFWGECDGVGSNFLGNILMHRRSKL